MVPVDSIKRGTKPLTKGKNDMTDYTKLEKEVDAQADAIWDMASNVWTFAELGFEEVQSSAYESAVLEKNGVKQKNL